VPADALKGLAPGARVLWRVEGRAADGSKLASPTFVQRVE
jgi:hypothetical protein